jgi:hypothetical protein
MNAKDRMNLTGEQILFPERILCFAFGYCIPQISKRTGRLGAASETKGGIWMLTK